MNLTSPASPRAARFADAAAAALLFLATLLFTFGPGGWDATMSSELVTWDDPIYINDNGWLLNLSWENVLGVFTNFYISNYHPLTMLSYMIEFQFFGIEAPGYKFVNLVLHALTIVVAFGIFRTLSVPRALATGLLLFFALHPLRIESVYWVSERKDVLCGLFYLLAVWGWLAARQTTGHRATSWLALAFLAFLLGGLSKAMIVSLPVVLILIEIFRPQPEGRTPRLCLIAVILATSALIAWINILAQDAAIVRNSILKDRVLLAATAPGWYMLKTLWPVDLSPIYPMAYRPSLSTLAVGLSFAFLAAATSAVVLSIRRGNGGLALGLLAAGFVLGPVSGIIPIGSAFAADRYTYLPTIFLLLGIAIEATPYLRTRPERDLISGCIFGAIAFALSFTLTPAHVAHWSTSEAFWSRILALYPEETRAVLNLRHVRSSDAASLRIESSVSIPPNRSDLANSLHRLNALSFMKERKFAQALEEARQIKDADMRLTWILLIQAQDNPTAQDTLPIKQAAEIASPSPTLVGLMAAALVSTGDLAGAKDILTRHRTPSVMAALAWGFLGQKYATIQRDQDARGAAKRGLAIFPAEFRSLQYLTENPPPDELPSAIENRLRRAARHPIAGSSAKAYALIKLGRIELKRGNQATALAGFRQAVEFTITEPAPKSSEATTAARADDPTRGAQALYIGRLLEDSGDVAGALACYRFARIEEASRRDAILNEGIILARARQTPTALKVLREGQQLYPQFDGFAQNILLIERSTQVEQTPPQ